MTTSDQRSLDSIQGVPQQSGVGVPRRFGVGVILLFTLAFALLYTLTKWLGAPVPVVGLLAGFFVVLGIGQAALFGGRKPREASMWVGLFYCPLAILAYSFMVRKPEEGIGCAMAGMVILGPVFGYLFGGVLAGLFLTPGMHPGPEPVGPELDPLARTRPPGPLAPGETRPEA